MQIPKLTLITPKIQSGELFPALELVMESKALEEAIASTDSQEKRKRILPTYVVIALVIGMNLWSADSIIDVFKNLVAGLASQWIPKGCRWRTPNGSSISAARQRVGSRVMTRLFEKLARPLATLQTPGAFLNGLRWMATLLTRYCWRIKKRHDLESFSDRSDEKSAFEAIVFIMLRSLKARSRAFFIINLPSREKKAIK